MQQAGGGVAVPALISGDIDFTTSGSVAISAILKGAKLKVLFVVDAHPAMQILGTAEYQDYADLKEKQIGIISRGDTAEIAIRCTWRSIRCRRITCRSRRSAPSIARFAAIASGNYPAALVNASEVGDISTPAS